jgi:hypothetical protein
MPLFKPNVALEACPAKTAESIAYAATFTVLALILLSNYSASEYPALETQSLVSQQTLPSANTLEIDYDGFADLTTLTSNPRFESANTLEVENNPAQETTLESPALARLELAVLYEQMELPEIQPNLRALPTATWPVQSELSPQFNPDDYHLSLPTIDSQFALAVNPQEDLDLNSDMLTKNAIDSAAILEITVTGTEADRLSWRPDNIQRPLLPRPYRAQDLQRSFVLPPRIQALRP